LHLVGILFPHINDDARSESLQAVDVWRLISVLSILHASYRVM